MVCCWQKCNCYPFTFQDLLPTLTNPRKKIIIQLLGYRLRDGPKDNDMSEILLDGTQIQHRLIGELERGLEYEFRIAGRNKIGYKQEAVRFLHARYK